MAFERCCAYISKSALIHNIKLIRSMLSEDDFLFAVVKADAYGHGSSFVSDAIEGLVDGLCVASVSEGVALRKSGIKKPVLVLGYTSPSQYETLLEYNVIPAIWRYDDALKFNETAKEAGVRAELHIAVNSGMNRIGYDCSTNSVCEIEKISKLPDIMISGIFTHLSCADMNSEAAVEFTDKQISDFSALIDMLKEKGVDIPLKHAYNSAAIIERRPGVFNGVRSGIINYGLYPSDEVRRLYPDLRPVMQFKARVINISNMPKGSAVGYGAAFVSEKDMRVATVSAGYADGYLRLLSCRGRVLIRGRYAPILGRVCMDQFMVDVTDIPDAQLEDEATLFGTDGEKTIPVEEIAASAGTINYEIVCGISKRVPRIIIS